MLKCIFLQSHKKHSLSENDFDTRHVGPDLNQSELALRGMAREPRFARRILGKFFRDFMDLAAQRIIESRTLISPESNIAYVFLAKPHGEDRQYRVAELGGRCFVVRGLQQNCKTVIGIATEQYQPGQGFSFDIVYLRQETWTDENQKQLENAQKEFGWFTSPQQTSVHEDAPIALKSLHSHPIIVAAR